MGLSRSTDLKSYKNERIEAEKSWVSSEVQIWTYKEGRKKMGFSRSTDFILYENKGLMAEKSRIVS